MRWILIALIACLVTCLLLNGNATFSSEPLNAGNQWLQATEAFRIGYVMGYRDGAKWSILPMVGLFRGTVPENKYQETSAKAFSLMFELNKRDWITIKDVMTSLYRDPANNNIEAITMTDLATKKLKGTLTDEDLRNARRNASE